MTAQELVRIAKNINPYKYDADPQAAIEDAYIVWEAVRLAELEKVSEKPVKVTDGLLFPEKRKKKLSTIEELRARYQKGPHSGTVIAKALGVSSGTFYNWLNGKFKPTAERIAKIEAYLTGVGHYE